MSTSAEISKVVRESDTAAAWGPEFPPAASTPFVLSLAELACHRVMAPELAQGELTVGARVEVEHLRPTPVGALLTARATMVDRQHGKASFTVEISDAKQVVAIVDHTRVIVERAAIEALLAEAERSAT